MNQRSPNPHPQKAEPKSEKVEHLPSARMLTWGLPFGKQLALRERISGDTVFPFINNGQPISEQVQGHSLVVRALMVLFGGLPISEQPLSARLADHYSLMGRPISEYSKMVSIR